MKNDDRREVSVLNRTTHALTIKRHCIYHTITTANDPNAHTEMQKLRQKKDGILTNKILSFLQLTHSFSYRHQLI
jgi:hypothetical protein